MKVRYAFQELENLPEGFEVPAGRVKPWGNGHINDTYRVTFENEQGVKKHYILQQMNKSIFKNPVELMENIVGVTEFLKRKISANGGNLERETFILKFTDRGRIWTRQGHSLNLSLIWNISGK